MPVELIDPSPESLFALIEQIRGDPDDFNPAFEHLILRKWAAIRVYLPQPDIQSAITPPYMEAFLELQKQVYQLVALAITGVADVGQLSDLDRRELQINVIVSGGSSNYLADLTAAINNALTRMAGKMTAKQSVIVWLSTVVLLTGTWGITSWLEKRKEVQIEELKTKEHIEALRALSFADKEHTETLDKALVILRQQGEVGQRAIDAVEATNEALLRAAAKTPTSYINGTELTRHDAELLRVSPKKKPETKFVKQRIRVVAINTSDPLDLNLVLMDPDTLVQHRIKFTDSLFAGPDRHKLFEALETRHSLWVELAIKEIGGEIRSVQLLRCIEPPPGLADLD